MVSYKRSGDRNNLVLFLFLKNRELFYLYNGEQLVIVFLKKRRIDDMKIETNLAAIVAGGVAIFIVGEVVGYYKCDRHYLRKQVDELQNR
jgi:hypothetical protein